MKYLVFFLCVSTSHAADYELFYLVNGKRAETVEALSVALKGGEVMKCQSVEAKPSKSGTSISLHNVKRRTVSQ